MEWNEKLQLIIDEVEIHLQRKEEPVDQEQIAKLAGCSYAFFQKVFSYMHGYSFTDYIRFRKLTLAGFDIKHSSAKVVDISLKYGYDSPTSFTKAFTKFHGVTPTDARCEDVKLMVFPKLVINTTLQTTWCLHTKPAMRLIAKVLPLGYEEDRTIQIPSFWNSCQKDGTYAKLVSLDQGEPKGMLGIFLEEKDGCQYALAVISNAKVPVGYHELYLPEETWAVFDCKGTVPKAIQQGWMFLQKEWLDRYPFKHASCPEVEWYSDGNPYDDDFVSQIWIPIVEE